ncbi:MAG TPA: oligosaccharide flippase family protein [Ktedonobacteraceae bacterium]|nr:oligosaccharide flippase family protein [Ktedonobacteraceae bacterium]
MSDHLARPSQQASQRRMRRLNFRPLIEDAEEQETLKVPASTPESVRRLRDFLPAARPAVEGLVENEFSPVTQKSRLPTTPPPAHEKGPPLTNGPQFPLHTREGEPAMTPPNELISQFKPKERRANILQEEARQRDVTMLDTIKSAVPDVSILKVQRDVSRMGTHKPPLLDEKELRSMGFDPDDPELEKRSTIPMMVLTGIANRQGKQQTEMKSEVSGAAGAAGLVGIGNILGSVLKFISTFLIQYGFGAGGYGLYSLGLSLINLVAAVFNLGLDDAMVRYVAIYRGKKQIKSLQGLLLFCTTLAGLAGIAGALLLLFFAPPLVSFWVELKHRQLENADMLNRAIALLQVMTPVIPLMTMQVMWFAGLRGFKAFKWRVLSTSILQPIIQILLMLLVIRFFHDRDGITAVAVVLFISTLVSTVLNMYFLFKQVARVATPEPEKYEVREWLTFATLNFLTTIIDTVLDSIDTILLAAFGLSDGALGQYGAAMRLSNFIALPLASLNNIFAPTIAELHSKGESQKLEAMFKIVTKWSITFSLPIFLIMVLFSPYLLALPGAAFIPAWPLLIAFALGSMLNAGTGSVGYMLLMTGYQKLSFLNSLVAVVVNIALGVYLTPRYGAMGTAVSTGLAICALNLMRVLQVRLLLKMHPYKWDVFKPIGAGAISAACTGGLLLLLHHSHIRTEITLRHAVLSVQLLLIPVFLACYIGLVIAFKASPEDEIVLKALRKKFLRGKKNSQKKKKVQEA